MIHHVVVVSLNGFHYGFPCHAWSWSTGTLVFGDMSMASNTGIQTTSSVAHATSLPRLLVTMALFHTTE
jgi:hypothetical protein